MTTLTITVNIATGNKYEGNAEFKLGELKETQLRHLDRNQLATELDELINTAFMDYQVANNMSIPKED